MPDLRDNYFMVNDRTIADIAMVASALSAMITVIVFTWLIITLIWSGDWRVPATFLVISGIVLVVSFFTHAAFED